DPSDLQAFFCEVQKFHLNGVFEPFWRDWVLTDPSCFFTPETLHVYYEPLLITPPCASPALRTA
ncbi:uncharacterized protein F5891DRAFT_948322, partial [Suillus fuscotomentosus]